MCCATMHVKTVMDRLSYCKCSKMVGANANNIQTNGLVQQKQLGWCSNSAEFCFLVIWSWTFLYCSSYNRSPVITKGDNALLQLLQDIGINHCVEKRKREKFSPLRHAGEYYMVLHQSLEITSAYVGCIQKFWTRCIYGLFREKNCQFVILRRMWSVIHTNTNWQTHKSIA